MGESVILVTFRGEKLEFRFLNDEDTTTTTTTPSSSSSQSILTVGGIRLAVATAVSSSPSSSSSLEASDVKLIYKGKVLTDDHVHVKEILFNSVIDGKKKALQKSTTTYRIMAMGVSKRESDGIDQALLEGIQKSKALVKDDLTREGRMKLEQKRILGGQILHKADQKERRKKHEDPSSTYGFDLIETLPNLPNEIQARRILTTLANDPGIKACMAKHRWHVGSLAELYPEGKVGETEICVMGLNKNMGQQILLRIRTDDLKGFRKMLSIREVLYHELAHNVHSEHDGKFFQLMREIKKDCLEMDWTKGHGTSSSSSLLLSSDDSSKVDTSHNSTVGTYRLGGETRNQQGMSSRDLARQAAIQRLMASQGGGVDEHQCFWNSSSCTCGLHHNGEHVIYDEDKMDEA